MYKGDNVSGSGGCEAAVTPCTRLCRVNFRGR